ncbi:sugar transferase [Lunatibacter salilacus]|uniref:sugar transferase n=1 Tax=Lunatibacter salilacus TaxID=2483804 RepID=UPI00131A760D|nr:sugar transferase [Lunatibacter salilacus]
MENRLPHIAIVTTNSSLLNDITEALGNKYELTVFSNGISLYHALTKEKLNFDSIISVSGLRDAHGITLKKTIIELGFAVIPFFLILDKIDPEGIKASLKEQITDVFTLPLQGDLLKNRVDFQIKHPIHTYTKTKTADPSLKPYKIPFVKRLIDILGSGLVLLLLSPLFLIIGILIKLESKGPVFYYSYRVGTGYNIFKFYKLRSMQTGSDANLQNLKHLNQYTTSNEETALQDEEVKELCEFCEQAGGGCLQPLYDDNKVVCERLFHAKNTTNKEAAFIKIKDDPRVTRIGKFIRNTSIDELPQLWNVLKGDMSLVGNRPLPLYEAEKITTDKYALRFLGPAGITGLWQVEKRGRGEMSEDERLSLDNDYVKNFSIWFDFKIILRTIPALFQSESV